MKIHECKHCGGRHFLVSTKVERQIEVDATGKFVKFISDEPTIGHPSDDDVWVCSYCGKRAKGKDIKVKGVKTIHFTDIDNEITVGAEIVKETAEYITIHPYLVVTAYECSHPDISAYDQQTFNLWYKSGDNLYVKDENNNSHLWVNIVRSYCSKIDIDECRLDELKEFKKKN